jgi:hypothetical protein
VSKFEENRIFILNNPNAPRLCPELAAEIGLHESIILLQIDFWIAIHGHWYDDKKWTYQSVRDIQRKFPYMSTSTVNRAIQSLIKQGVVFEGNYNKYKYDKTRWFAINFEGCRKLRSISIAPAWQQADDTSDGGEGHGTGHDTRSNQDGTRSTQFETGPCQDGTGSTQFGTTIPETSTETSKEKSTETSTETSLRGATACAAPAPQGHASTPAPISFSDSSSSNRVEKEDSFSKGKDSSAVEQAAAGAGRAASFTSERVSASGPARELTEGPTSDFQRPGAAAGCAALDNATGATTAPTRAGSGKPRDPNLDHPAVVAFKEFWGYYPEEWARELIANHVGEDEESLEDWESAMRHWSTISGNFKNVNQQVKIYLDHEWERPLTNDRSVQRDWDEYKKAIEGDEPRDPTLDHPAVVRFHEIWYTPEMPRILNPNQRRLIVEEIGDDPVAIEDWVKAVTYWSGLSGAYYNLRMQFQIFHTREWEQKRGGASSYKTAAEKRAENYRRGSERVAAAFESAREQEGAVAPARPFSDFFESMFGGQKYEAAPDDVLEVEYTVVDEHLQTVGTATPESGDAAIESLTDNSLAEDEAGRGSLDIASEAVTAATEAIADVVPKEDCRITMDKKLTNSEPKPEQVERILAEITNEARWIRLLNMKKWNSFEALMQEYHSKKRAAGINYALHTARERRHGN